MNVTARVTSRAHEDQSRHINPSSGTVVEGRHTGACLGGSAALCLIFRPRASRCGCRR